MIEAEHTFTYSRKTTTMGRVIEMKINVCLDLDMERDWEGSNFTKVPTSFEVFIGEESLVEGNFEEMPTLLSDWIDDQLQGMNPDDFGLEYCDFNEESFS